VLEAARAANFCPESEDSPQINPENGLAENEERIETAAEGLQKNVGVRGSHISGGQKQRVAIARALLRSPNVLLLDEATSALDPGNERRVQAALDRTTFGRTSLTVTHKLETVKTADQIFVLEKGRIVEQGTYDELFQQNHHFLRLLSGEI
jgi:ATP-binding cassette subfamily B (MDR/TAP) protein 1